MNTDREYKLKEILKQIEEKRRLIGLTQLMAGCPRSEGGISYESAAKTIQLFHTDIIKLEKEYKKLEPFGESINTSNFTHDLRKNIEQEQNTPPKVEEKYKRETFKRNFKFYNNDIRNIPKPKQPNYILYGIVIIILLFSLIYISNIPQETSVSFKTTPTIISTPTPIPTPISIPYKTNIPPTPIQNVNRYIDDKGNLHEIVNGYDRIVDTDKSVTESKNKETLQDKINKKYITESGIIGSWKFENGNGWMIYIFKEDGTLTFDNSVVGKVYYSYTISNNNINMISKDQTTFDGKPSTVSYKYRLENNDNLVLTIMGMPVNFVRI